MKIFRDSYASGRIKGAILTLGNFDGLHLGHKKVITGVVRRARALGAKSVVYTFDPHPLKVLAPHKSPPLILDIETKTALIKALEIDYLVLAPFTREMAEKHPRQFVEEVIVKALRAREVWVGHDFSFGKGKTGTIASLVELGSEFGFGVKIVGACRQGGATVSSSRIRALISSGEVAKAKKLLGRPYCASGTVVRGKDLGKKLGFPTANVSAEGELIPANGVYAAFATIAPKGKRGPAIMPDKGLLKAVVNIGTSPTFGNYDITVEAHLLNFNKDLYGKRLSVFFVRKLRDEKTFSSKDTLTTQIKKDASRAEALLDGYNAND